MKIDQILETQSVVTYLQTHNLLALYQKVKAHILAGHYSGAQLRKRRPKTDDIWYFRINKKFRALAYFEGTTLKVFAIDDHQ